MKLQTHKKQMLREETLYDNYNKKKEWNEKNVRSLKNGVENWWLCKNILSLDKKLQSSYYHYIIFLACINSAWW